MLFKKFFPEFVYGGMDGLITTFAIITGAYGAGLDNSVIIIIGIASIFADAFSMGASNFVSQRSYCRIKHNHECKNNLPVKTAFSTFISFLVIGFIPILPFVFQFANPFTYSLTLTFLLFFLIGFAEGKISKSNPFKTGLSTLLIGIVAAAIAYGIGHFLSGI